MNECNLSHGSRQPINERTREQLAVARHLDRQQGRELEHAVHHVEYQALIQDAVLLESLEERVEGLEGLHLLVARAAIERADGRHGANVDGASVVVEHAQVGTHQRLVRRLGRNVATEGRRELGRQPNEQ